MKNQKTIKVKETIVDGKKCFGIAKGKYWFFYAYTTKEAAEIICKGLCETEIIQRVNLGNDRAYKLTEYTAEDLLNNRGIK